MLFSQQFGLNVVQQDDWFDPILDTDTRLFVDPFLIFKEQTAPWNSCHQKLIDHFDRCFRLLAQGNRNPNSVPYRKAVDLLAFPEPREFCLGYTLEGTAGAGSGRGYAKKIAEAMCDAIERGKTHLAHFEELGIFNKGIGADRISDVTCTILKRELIDYTRSVVERHGLPTVEKEVWAAEFDETRQRWQSKRIPVLENPSHGGALLLVPRRFLRELPQLNDQDWWDWYEDQRLRDDVNYEVLGHVDKETIVETARRNPSLVEKYIDASEDTTADPYDFDRDPLGLWRWVNAAKDFVDNNRVDLQAPVDQSGFLGVIGEVVDSFRHFVEERGGWRLLWNDNGKEKPEEAAQLLFRSIAQYQCEANGIVVDREVDLGRGPVDFKFSNGQAFRALLEIKKLHNGKFWNGLEAQLTSYLSSDEARHGWYLAIQYRSGGASENRLKELPSRIRAANEREDAFDLRYAVVDGRPKASASKL